MNKQTGLLCSVIALVVAGGVGMFQPHASMASTTAVGAPNASSMAISATAAPNYSIHLDTTDLITSLARHNSEPKLSRIHDRAVRLSQEDSTCESGYSVCDSGGCCPSNTPFHCPGSRTCYQTSDGAQQECGNNYEICHT